MVAKNSKKTVKSTKSTKVAKSAKVQVKDTKLSAPMVEEGKTCSCDCGCGCGCGCRGCKVKKFLGLVLLIVIVNVLMMALVGPCPCAHRGPHGMERGDRPCPHARFGFAPRGAKEKVAPAPVAKK